MTQEPSIIIDMFGEDEALGYMYMTCVFVLCFQLKYMHRLDANAFTEESAPTLLFQAEETSQRKSSPLSSLAHPAKCSQRTTTVRNCFSVVSRSMLFCDMYCMSVLPVSIQFSNRNLNLTELHQPFCLREALRCMYSSSLQCTKYTFEHLSFDHAIRMTSLRRRNVRPKASLAASARVASTKGQNCMHYYVCLVFIQKTSLRDE